ncbi:MAG: UDP-N-acetylmuramoyl-L-alanyl-D-glutamate--2,6-diaminopimelate ligase [Anaerolineae bacterium]|nr:UDP-N-acetylmuramoyl-L-alanyl-D-glutamate--2,6-diaminopimelate ligase [Anaerolineae bacterium]
MKLSDLLSALPFGFPPPDTDPDITAPVTEDSRKVQPGGVFVARRGRGMDGHQYIDQAVRAGAAAIIGEEPTLKLPVAYVYVNDSGQALGHLASAYYEYPSHKLVVIGVTGTDGKTTTSNVAYHILKTAGVKVGMISTVSAIIGEQEIPTGLHVTTPPAHEIHLYLNQMVDAGLTHCVLEVTSHGLDQGRVNGVDFDVAVMTNITHEHLDWHGSFEAYRDAKARLFRITAGHPPRGDQPTITIINVDDSSATHFAQASIGANYMLLYSLHNPQADFYADRIHYRPNGTSFMLRGNAGDIAINSPLVGEFNIYNVIAGAIAAISAMPQPIHQQRMLHAVPMGIQSLPQIPGRMEVIDEGQDFLAVVDFAHTPNALQQALKAARSMVAKAGRVITVFGSAGLRDVEKRRLMAETAAALADIALLTAEDPRTESLAEILEVMANAAISKGGVEGETFFRVRDRGEALYRACQMAKAGDIVIACGKGHEQSMCFGTVEHPWDDRNALRAALRKTPARHLPTADPERDKDESWLKE